MSTPANHVDAASPAFLGTGWKYRVSHPEWDGDRVLADSRSLDEMHAAKDHGTLVFSGIVHKQNGRTYVVGKAVVYDSQAITFLGYDDGFEQAQVYGDDEPGAPPPPSGGSVTPLRGGQPAAQAPGPLSLKRRDT